MITSLSETLDVMDQRKLAVIGEPPQDVSAPRVTRTGFEGVLMLLSGFDVEPEEVQRVSGNAAAMALSSMMSGNDVVMVLRSLWVDAFTTGMMHERRAAGR